MNKRPCTVMLICFVLGETAVMQTDMALKIILAASAAGLSVIFFLRCRQALLLLLFFCSLMMGMAVTALDTHKPPVSPGEYAELEGDVDDCVPSSSGGMSLYIRVTDIRIPKVKFEGGSCACLYLDSQPDIRPGDSVYVTGKISEFVSADNPGGFDERKYQQARGADFSVEDSEVNLIKRKRYSIKGALFLLRNNLRSQYAFLLPEKEAGLADAMVLGDKSSMSRDIKDLYSRAGIGHLVAISALHVGLIGSLIFTLLRRRLLLLPSALISFAVLISYGVLTGMSGSAERAVIMLICAYSAKVIGRGYDLLSAMSVAALIILINEPHMLFDAGFLMSFGSVAGIGIVFRLMEETKANGEDEKQIKAFSAASSAIVKSGKSLISSLKLSLSIQMVTAPLIAWFYYEIPPYGILLNLIVIPLMSLLLPVLLVSLSVSILYLPAGQICILPARAVFYVYEVLCRISDRLPGSHLVTGRPEIWQMWLYYAVLVCALTAVYFFQRRSIWIVLLAAFGILFIPDMTLSVHMLYIGQGDAIVITRGNDCMTIDGGSSSLKSPGEKVMEPALRALGQRNIDLAVITHEDRDHISGISELIMSGFPVKTLVLPDTLSGQDSYRTLENMGNVLCGGTRYIKKGDEFTFAGADFTCLHPPSGYKSPDANSYSTTLLMEYMSHRMLFTGDLTGEGEDWVAQELSQMGVHSLELLKAAHHGSDYSTLDPFLTAVHPCTALVSAGRGNIYGHPGRNFMARLEEHGIPVYTTIDHGCMRVDFTGSLSMKLWR